VTGGQERPAPEGSNSANPATATIVIALSMTWPRISDAPTELSVRNGHTLSPHQGNCKTYPSASLGIFEDAAEGRVACIFP
jgi:hypothetical protein